MEQDEDQELLELYKTVMAAIKEEPKENLDEDIPSVSACAGLQFYCDLDTDVKEEITIEENAISWDDGNSAVAGWDESVYGDDCKSNERGSGCRLVVELLQTRRECLSERSESSVSCLTSCPTLLTGNVQNIPQREHANGKCIFSTGLSHFEQVFVDEEFVAVDDAVALDRESALFGDMLAPRGDVLAMDRAWTDFSASALERSTVPTTGEDTEVSFLEYLHFDLLPNCSVQLTRLEARQDVCGDADEKGPSENSTVNEELTCKDLSDGKGSRRKKRKFHCRECVAKFPSKRDLRIHMHVHATKEMFLCPHCDQKFSWEASLRRHLKAHAVFTPAFLSKRKTNKTKGGTTVSARRKAKKLSHSIISTTNSTMKGRNPSANPTSKINSGLLNASTDDTMRGRNLSSNPKIEINHCLFNPRTDGTVEGSKVSSCLKNKRNSCLSSPETNSSMEGSTVSSCSKIKRNYSLRTPKTNVPVDVSKVSSPLKRKGNFHLSNPRTCDTTGCSKVSFSLKNKSYSCVVCEDIFSRKYNLKLHMYVHTRERPHACKVCGAKFSVKESLVRHALTHTGERPHSCMLCGMAFSQRTHLKTHMDTHAGAKYTCSVCKQVFTQKVYLMRHVRIHSGERPYSCPDCGATFANTSSASRHRRLHTGRKPYACADCDTRFVMKETLKYHVEKQHCK